MTHPFFTINLILKTPNAKDLIALKEFEDRNINHLVKWESLKKPSFEAAQMRLNDCLLECQVGKSARFFIYSKEIPQKIIGMCNFTQIFRGAFQACYLGYKIDHDYEGKGHMFEALEYLIRHVFEELKLHRIMANYMPTNYRSEKLLKRFRF